MSFNTFCGQDPAVPANYQKLLLQFQEIQTLNYTQVDITDTNANADFFPVLTDAAGTGQRALFSDDGGFGQAPIRLNPVANTFQLGNGFFAGIGNGVGASVGGVGAGLFGFFNNAGDNLVGIGTGANASNAGDSSIAIGDAANNNNGSGFANSIVLNATGNPLNTNGNSRLHISGLRGLPTVGLGGLNQLHYNPATSELFYSTTP
jgi:hypothetical protein